jgi:ribonucleoside-triphosphate reductase (formate)
MCYEGIHMRDFFARKIDEGMGMAVAKRTYLREGESWADVAMRVAQGNCSLVPTSEQEEYDVTKAIAKASFLPAGRHLQHGDSTQKDRNIEVFSNCSTACSSFIKFYLLLNGSGVGRMYNDDMMLIDWRNMPEVILHISPKHPDFKEVIKQAFEDKPELYYQQLTHVRVNNSKVVNYVIEDSREGWAKGLELIEVMTYEKKHDWQIVLELSEIRENGRPIGGMQNRPASGPAPLAYAYRKISLVRNNIFSYTDYALGREVHRDLGPIQPWMQTILIDHYASECVANGGARRSARISVKYWGDEGIEDFINLKHEFVNSSGESILWSSNNSVGADQEFWKEHNIPGTKANRVYNSIVEASFGHGTGEPGIVNLDKLTANEEGVA